MTEDESKQLTKEIEKESESIVLLNGLKSHFDEYRNELSALIPNTKHSEVEKREEIYRQLKSINTVEARLLTAIQTGSLAREQLTMWQKCTNKLKVI